MIREIKKDRAGVIPYVLYFIYTVYMVVAAVYLKWPSWVAAVIICGCCQDGTADWRSYFVLL